jgi:5-methylcytosine-specific restriction endonuclease McrA
MSLGRYRVCAEPGCGELVPTGAGKCQRHRREPWAGSTRRQRLPKNWARIRKRILRRDPVCSICGESPSTEIDHLRPGDDHGDSNLQGLCSPCHASKSGREGREAQR